MEKDFSYIEKNQFFITVSSFFLGVLFASFFHIGIPLFISCAFFALGIFLYSNFAFKFSKKVFITFVLCLAFFALGTFRFYIKDVVRDDSNVDSHMGKQITFTATIVESPVEKENGRDYIVKAPSGSMNILVHTGLYPAFRYGDTVTFTGKLDVPKSFETDTGKVFDYPSYLKKNGVGYILSFAKGEHVSSGNAHIVTDYLFRIRDSFVRNIQKVVPEPGASLLTGILLGNDSMPKSIEDSFRRTGIVHIVVLSGYNITIVAESLVQVFAFLPKYFSLGAGAFGIILFSLMVGGTPSVFRASCMALLVLIAKFTGRTYDVGRALIISGFIMVFINPYLLVFDTSFQLSFLSTIALIWISPIIERYLEWAPHRFGIREVTCATLSTQLFVLPLILLKIGQVSLVGLPVNLLVLGVIPLLMLIGFVTGLLGYISHVIALPFAFLSHIILSYVFLVVKIFDSLSFASISIPYFGATLFITLYVFYGVAFFNLKDKKKSTN